MKTLNLIPDESLNAVVGGGCCVRVTSRRCCRPVVRCCRPAPVCCRPRPVCCRPAPVCCRPRCCN